MTSDRLEQIHAEIEELRAAQRKTMTNGLMHLTTEFFENDVRLSELYNELDELHFVLDCEFGNPYFEGSEQ